MTPDPRHLSHGREIPTESYSDQPYIVQTDDGAWLCCVTTGPGHEGAEGQHVATLRSLDQGRTWSEPVPVEPGDSRENSYAVMLKVPSGRVYIFYNHNTDNVREVRWHDGQSTYQRVDSLGHFVLKYSDDHGRSWSAERYDLPFRLFECDRANVYGGALCFFWNVGKPFVHEGRACVSLHKVGQMGRGFFQQSEGVLLVSDNLLTETDPAQIRWETLPDGEIGLRTPAGGGLVSEEHSYSVLSDGAIYCVYRSIDGYPVEAYSRDGGHTWTPPRYKCFADGRRMKNPRAANFTWKCRNGRYLHWFHNHGGRVMREAPHNADWGAFDDRNPVWLSAGLEIDTPGGREIAWSEPEIILYDDDPFVRISYPDLLEEEGRYYISETQKDMARVHEIPAALLEAMWATLAAALGQSLADPWDGQDESLLLELPAAGEAMPDTAALPPLPWFRVRDNHAADYRGKDTGAGLTLEIALQLPDLQPGRVLLDNRDAAGRGFALRAAAAGALELSLSDGQTESHWTSDPVLTPGQSHHVVVNLDGGPRVVSYIIDGRFGDGGDERQFGWGRFSPHLRHVNGAAQLRLAPCVTAMRLYGRVLLTCEAISLYRSRKPC
ncbi:MAG: glycoside hydrolase [Armatimonadetes bacterium]|nr:glycoside hydrolase [Armatimonadota bacterium]